MRLDQLLKRENFYSIIKKTLTRYFRSSSEWTGKIFLESYKGEDILGFRINTKLNLIYPEYLPKKALLPLVSEYAHHKNPLRTFLQNSYIKISLSKLFRNLFSPTNLYISDKSNLPQKFCIIPGNHTIRIIDLDHNKCVVLLKDGFNTKKLSDLISIRESYPDLPGPKIIDTNLSEGWYSEERISGLPLNRLSCNDKRKRSLEATSEFLSKMYKTTQSCEQIDEYIESRFEELDTGVNSLPDCFTSSDVKYIKKIISELLNLSGKVLDGKSKIKVSQTHGDLQDANLLVPDEDPSRSVYIIDWEYTKIRCSHYDWFVYGLQSRFPDGLCARIEALIKNFNKGEEDIFWLNFIDTGSENLISLITIFLIEDFLFRLDDSNIPNLAEVPQGFYSFLQEIEYFLEIDL